MKSYVILALLLIWQRNAFASEDTNNPTSAPPTELTISARLLVTPIKATGNPVDLARKLLFDLEQFNLIGEVVQAKHIEYDDSHRLLFEMSNALQAQAVVEAWADPECIPCKSYQLSQAKDDFFDSQIDPLIDIRMA